jgi:hypothetical protein
MCERTDGILPRKRPLEVSPCLNDRLLLHALRCRGINRPSLATSMLPWPFSWARLLTSVGTSPQPLFALSRRESATILRRFRGLRNGGSGNGQCVLGWSSLAITSEIVIHSPLRQLIFASTKRWEAGSPVRGRFVNISEGPTTTHKCLCFSAFLMPTVPLSRDLRPGITVGRGYIVVLLRQSTI